MYIPFFRMLVRRCGFLWGTVILTVIGIAFSILVSAGVMFAVMGQVDPGGLAIGLLVPLIVSPFFTLPMLHTIAEVEEARRQMQELADTDSLTSTYNRRFFTRRLDHEWQAERRYGGEFSIAILDVDDFKSINDRFGHPAGDEVLASIAEICLKHTRTADLFARYGGEEFAVLMPHTGAGQAREGAERIAGTLARTPVKANEHMLYCTVSVGVATSRPADTDPDQVLLRADKALYQAKNAGKNKVVVGN